eukprot:UN04286
MGGAFAAYAAKSKAIEGLVGLVVVDVVETSASAALPNMLNIVRKRPQSFPNLEKAISWAYNTGVVKNFNSCRLHVPSQLKKTEKICIYGEQNYR